jgi:hypothetical protein
MGEDQCVLQIMRRVKDGGLKSEDHCGVVGIGTHRTGMLGHPGGVLGNIAEAGNELRKGERVYV